MFGFGKLFGTLLDRDLIVIIKIQCFFLVTCRAQKTYLILTYFFNDYGLEKSQFIELIFINIIVVELPSIKYQR